MGFFKHLIGLALCLLPVTLEANSYSDPSGSNPLVNLVGDYYMGGNSNGSILCQGAADETGCNAAFAIGFNFDWHGTTYTHGLMSTNGCLKLLTSSSFNSATDYCSYEVNHLGPSYGMNDTLYPFWSDLDLGTALQTQAPHDSTMLFDTGPGVAIFGWYYMREYGVTADTDQYDPQYPNAHNTFEIVLLDQNCSECPGNADDENDDYAYIYGNLEISHSNVLIGEKKDSDTFNEKYFFSDNSWCADCVNPQDGTLGRYTYIWDDYDQGNVEGGAIYKDGNGVQPAECENNPLFSTSCSLYSISFLAQQCLSDSSYSPDCDGYFGDLEDTYLEENACYEDPSLPQCAGLGIFETFSDYDYATGEAYDFNYNPQEFGNMDGYDPNTGLVTQSDGSTISIDGSYYSDGYDPNVDYDSMNNTSGDNFYLNEDGIYVPDQYDPMQDDDIKFEYLSEEQQMLVGQGLSMQEATLITMGQGDLLALGHDPNIQFQGNNPGDLVYEIIGQDDYNYEMHDEFMLNEAEENGWVDGYTSSDIWSTEEYQQQEDMWEAEFEAEFGPDAYSWTSKDWYEYDLKEFGQDQVDEWYGKEVVFDESGEMDWESFDMLMDEEYAYEVYEVYSDEEELMYEEMIAKDFEKCPTCELEEFFDLSEDELIAFENERMYEEEAYFDLDPEEAFEAFIKEEGLEDILSADELDDFRNEVYADIELHEEQHEEQFQEGPGDYQVAESTTPKAQEQRQEQRQEQQKTDTQFLSNAGSGVMSVSVAQFNLDFNSSDGGSTQEVVEELIADIIDDGSGSIDDGSGSFDDGSGSSNSSGNDGSGSYAQSNDGSSQSQNSNGSQDSGQGMLAQEDTSGDSFFQEQIEQSMGQESFSATTSVTESFDTGAFTVAESSADAQTVQQEETLQFVENFDDGTSGISGADIQFEDELTTALSSGTGLTEFLSQAPADYSRFEVEAPTFQEQRQSDAVESLADTMGATVAAANLQAELDTIQAGNEDSNEYGDQTIAVAYIGYTAGFSEYTSQIQLADQQAWYGSSQVYKGQKNVDNVQSFYMMAGNTQEKLKEMIYSQYKLKEK